MIFRYQIEEDSITVKAFLVKQNIPANMIKNLKTQNGQILVNDQTVSGIYEMKKNDRLEIVFPSSEQGENIESVKGDFKIVYEDSYLCIIDKESNLATIPTRKHYNHSLANFVMSYYKRKGIEANIHFVSRLDAPTSGLIILAKNSYMTTLMKDAELQKYYLLEVWGNLPNTDGIIETGIERDPNSIIKRRITNKIKNSKTKYHVLEKKEETTIVEALLCTGKTHQLRLHFDSLGHPILGDALYDEERAKKTDILHLHSFRVSFIHPITKEKKEFCSYPNWYTLS